MSGGEPLWRRVAGLYLSGIPADANDRVSTRAPMEDGVVSANSDPTSEIIMLGEALDLVTLAQGYRSPAVPLLLRALIRVVRQVAVERAEAVAIEEAAAAEAASAAPNDGDTGSVSPAAEEVAGNGTAEDETAAAPETLQSVDAVDDTPAKAPDAPETSEAAEKLEKRIVQTDQKVAALTSAVGQLVEVLQRRARDSGGVDRRIAPRLPGTNATVFLHGQPYDVVNWGQGGFLIRISEADRFSRGGFDFHFVLDLPDETVEFQGRARPVRIERTTLAAEFVALDTTTAEKLAKITAGLVPAD